MLRVVFSRVTSKCTVGKSVLCCNVPVITVFFVEVEKCEISDKFSEESSLIRRGLIGFAG